MIFIKVSRFEDGRGVLIPIEGERDVPFAIKRRWIIKDVPPGETRGGHAHKRAWQFAIPIVGSFTVTVRREDQEEAAIYVLDRDCVGLVVEPGIWFVLSDFSPGAVCEVLSDTYYDEEDYIK